jgi:hypothetical protein
MIWIIWQLFIITDVYWNAVKIKKGLHIFHGFESLYRGIAFIAIYFVFKVDHLNMIQNVSFVLGCFFSGWLIFNIALNGFRGEPITYLGEASILDRVEALVPIRMAAIFFKFVLAVGAISAFYYGTLNPMG